MPKRTCLVCGGEYADAAYCPKDGSPLTAGGGDPMIGAVLLDRYKIDSLLGRGGMSVVYKATHLLMRRNAAIKLLTASDSQSLKRFHQEAKLAASLNHGNIVTIYDFGVSRNGQAFLAMDYLEGHTLAAVVANQGAIHFSRAMPIFIQACGALTYAHKQGVIHRDLKPSNFILVSTEDGTEQLKLLDFGIAKQIAQEGKETQALTGTGEVFGSPLYMSPEQCLGNSLDARADIYSFGCVMYEVLTGRPPLAGRTSMETLHRHITEEAERLTTINPNVDLPPRLESIVLKALERDPDQRYQSAQDLWNDLKAFASAYDGQAITAEPIDLLPARQSGSGIPAIDPTPTEGDVIIAHPVESQPQEPAPAAKAAAKKTLSPPLIVASAMSLLMILGVVGFSFYRANLKNNDAQKTTVVSSPIANVSMAEPETRWQDMTARGEQEFIHGNYVGAAPLFHQAYHAASQAGTDNLHAAKSLNDLGNLYYKQDNYKEAETCFLQALTIRKKLAGANSLLAADTMDDLGLLYGTQGELGKAESLLQQAYQIRKKQSGEQSQETMDTLRSLAIVYHKKGRMKEARKLLDAVLKFNKSKSGVNSPEVADADNGLALNYQLTGNLTTAYKYYAEALQAAERSLGPDHPLAAESLLGIGTVQFNQNKMAAAEASFNRALDIREKTFGRKSLPVAEVVACLAILYDQEGKRAQALALMKEALNTKDSILGPESNETKRTRAMYERMSKGGR